MADREFVTSSDATRALFRSRSSQLSRSIALKRSDKVVRPLKERLSLIKEEDENTPAARPLGYGVVEIQTERIFRQIDNQGRLHTIDVIQGDNIDSVLAILVDANTTGIIYPGDFPGQLRDDGTVFSGRFSGVTTSPTGDNNGTQIRIFDGTQGTADPDLVAQTDVDSQFIGRGIAYIWGRWVFQDGRFDGDPTLRVITRSRKILDPRNSVISPSVEFEQLPKTFSINPYRMIFDYLLRPRVKGGAGRSISEVDIDSFVASTIWSEALVDTVEFTRTAILTTRTNQQLGTPPTQTNHLLEFETDVTPFQYGDVVRIDVGPNQTLPSNLSSATEYHVIVVRHAVGDFQLPAIALAETLEDALAGNSIPQGDRISDINVRKVKEIRFQSGSTFKSGDSILDALLESCGARLYLNDGKIAISQQSFPEPADIEAVTLDELIGSISLSTSTDSDERATSLSGSYTSITNIFIPKDYPAVSGGGVFTAQDGQSTLRTYDLPFVAKASVAQRLATIELRRRRQELTLALSGDLSLYRLKPNTIFTLDFPRYNLDEQTFFEVRDATMFVRISGDIPQFGMNIEAKQLEEGTFDLDITNAQFVDAAKIPGLNSPFDVTPPGIPQISEALFRARAGGGIKTRVDMTWSASLDQFIVSYRVGYRQVGNPDFIFLAETPDTNISIFDLPPGNYDFQVQAINSAGLASPAADGQRLDVQIFGLSARPEAPTNFRGQVVGTAQVLLRWDRATELDVLEGGFVEVRHSNLISGANARDSLLIDTDVGGKANFGVPFKQGTYFLRFEDSTGQFSEAAEWSTQDRRPVGTAQDVNLSDIGGFTIQEDTTFPSTDPNNTMIFDTDHLELPLEDTFDDEADVDAIANMDDVGGGSVISEGLYFFATDLELSAVTRVAIEATIGAEIFDLSSSLDDEPNFDQIPDVDAVAAASLEPGLATAEIQVRFSNGTIASDTFGPWETLDTQIFENRSFQFRIKATSTVPTINIRVTQARIRLRAVPLLSS